MTTPYFVSFMITDYAIYPRTLAVVVQINVQNHCFFYNKKNIFD